MCMKLSKKLSILSMLILIGNCAIKNFVTFTSNIPSYTYPYALNAGDTIVATLSWQTALDLDIYFYTQGSDLLSRSVWLAR